MSDTLVDGLVEWGSFDAVTDLAQPIPSTWFPIFLVGRRKPESVSLTGPMQVSNHSAPQCKGYRCRGQLAEMIEFAEKRCPEPRRAAAGKHGGRVQRGRRPRRDHKEQCPVILTGYLAPSPETTIKHAIANAIWLLATNPDQWDLLREDPSHVKVAFNEAVQLEFRSTPSQIRRGRTGR